MIKSFRCKHTQELFEKKRSRKFNALARQAFKKLRMLHVSTSVEDLRCPPGNRLEKLVGDREGQHSIRVNDAYRICFVWDDGHALDVEIVDYH